MRNSSHNWRKVALLLLSFTILANSGEHEKEATTQAASKIKPITNSSVGLNKPDLIQQYLGRAGGGFTSPAYQRVSQAMAKKAIIDAKNIGVTYFRVPVTGYNPSGYDIPGDLDLWIENPMEYWELFAQMIEELNINGIRIVPVFLGNWTQFPAMTRENTAEMITNPESESFKLLKMYIADFIERYLDHPMLYFYELTNELNLRADLDQVTQCQNENPFTELCLPVGNFSTDQMIVFTKRLADFVRSLDSNHLISSGFSLPRSAAEHIRRYPGWLTGGPDWTTDSLEEFKKNLAEIHEGLDIISIHFGNGKDNERFGIVGKYNADLLHLVKETADSLGKQLFIGEFVEDPPINFFPDALFMQNVLDKIVDLDIPYSAPWVWQSYQFVPYLHTSHSIESGFTDVFIEKLKETNSRLGNQIPSPQQPDTTRPLVVLTWPLEGATMDSSQLVHAVASDNNGSMSKVEFWVNQQFQSSVASPPYQFFFDTTPLTSGEHVIEAVAYDTSGNSAKYTTRAVNIGDVPTGSITANPNPCTLQPGETLCNTTISWRTFADPFTMNAHIYVSMDGNPTNSMACGSLTDSLDASWIQAGHTYEFLLYADPVCTDEDRGILLSSVTVTGFVTSVEQSSQQVREDFVLRQNYPNPFNLSTTISFDLPEAEHVTLKLYNLLGNEVATLVSENLKAGTYNVRFEAKGLASGVYVFRYQAGSFTTSKKTLLIK